MSWEIFFLIGIGIFAGGLSGLFGIGGGVFIVPMMVLFLGMTQKNASGTTLAAFCLPLGLAPTIEYYRHHQVCLKYTVILAISIIIGSYLSARWLNRSEISDHTMRKAFGILLMIISARYLFWDWVIQHWFTKG